MKRVLASRGCKGIDIYVCPSDLDSLHYSQPHLYCGNSRYIQQRQIPYFDTTSVGGINRRQSGADCHVSCHRVPNITQRVTWTWQCGCCVFVRIFHLLHYSTARVRSEGPKLSDVVGISFGFESVQWISKLHYHFDKKFAPWNVDVPFPVRPRNLSLVQHVQAGSEAYPVSYSVCLFSTTYCSLLRLIVRSGLGVPTFATRRLHACHHARAPSGGRWKWEREMSGNFA